MFRTLMLSSRLQRLGNADRIYPLGLEWELVGELARGASPKDEARGRWSH